MAPSIFDHHYPHEVRIVTHIAAVTDSCES